MFVRINGKMVEVGPSRTHKRNCGCVGKAFQKSIQDSSNQPKLIVNGHEVDMDNPSDVQRALRLCRTIGGIFFGIIVFILLTAASAVDWTNFDFKEDSIVGLFVLSVWFIIAFVFAILTPRFLQKRLDELKKQGKVPSRYQ